MEICSQGSWSAKDSSLTKKTYLFSFSSLLVVAIAHFLPGYSFPVFLPISQGICCISWDQFLMPFFTYNYPCCFEYLTSLCNCCHIFIPLYKFIKYLFDIPSCPDQALITITAAPMEWIIDIVYQII